MCFYRKERNKVHERKIHPFFGKTLCFPLEDLRLVNNPLDLLVFMTKNDIALFKSFKLLLTNFLGRGIAFLISPIFRLRLFSQVWLLQKYRERFRRYLCSSLKSSNKLYSLWMFILELRAWTFSTFSLNVKNTK